MYIVIIPLVTKIARGSSTNEEASVFQAGWEVFTASAHHHLSSCDKKPYTKDAAVAAAASDSADPKLDARQRFADILQHLAEKRRNDVESDDGWTQKVAGVGGQKRSKPADNDDECRNVSPLSPGQRRKALQRSLPPRASLAGVRDHKSSLLNEQT
ncbi:unnamed protein product [Soboliphyme baturini]|uniref:Uncharacterized protein n=1 Tax=Soboliphyme baturini TaxID=241478 RepID=A0A183IHJ1_9BILA|nr:unnamed protein product [Soboliphyme baturini]